MPNAQYIIGLKFEPKGFPQKASSGGPELKSLWRHSLSVVGCPREQNGISVWVCVVPFCFSLSSLLSRASLCLSSSLSTRGSAHTHKITFSDSTEDTTIKNLWCASLFSTCSTSCVCVFQSPDLPVLCTSAGLDMWASCPEIVTSGRLKGFFSSPRRCKSESERQKRRNIIIGALD